MTNDFLPSRFFDVEPTTVDTLRQKLVTHMNMLKSMDVYEMTLYKKWVEAQKYLKFINRSEVVKARIWTPTDILDKEQTVNEINALVPKIVYINPETDKSMMDDWLMLRVFCHTMAFDQNPGRFIRFMVYDEVTEKYLGATSIGSDVIAIGVRDKWIGWDKSVRLESTLKNSAIATCIMATQPLGYNMLGGKLIASLMTDDAVAEAWMSTTGNRLVGLTTTSLYGTESMYNGIPYWKKLGATQGRIYLKPDDSVYDEWHHWLQDNKPDEYLKATRKEGIVGPVTGIKQKILDLAFKTASISPSKYTHGFSRGVYYAPLYENAREYLRGEIGEDKLVRHPRMKGTESIVNWWRNKAINRYLKVYEESRLKPEILYYNDLIGVSWEDAKKLYLEEVGR